MPVPYGQHGKLVGKPSPGGEHVVIGGDENAGNPGNGPWEDNGQSWCPCPAGHHFDLAYPGKHRARFPQDGCSDYFGADGEERIAAAVQAALSHRFGKSGPEGAMA